MTNGEKYRTAEVRGVAFENFCSRHKNKGLGTIICSACPLNGRTHSCQFAWLNLEAEEEKPDNCPFCGGETSLVDVDSGLDHIVQCRCGYSSRRYAHKDEAIAAHNELCRKVKGNFE